MEGLPNIFDAVAHLPSGATPRRLLLATQEDKIAGTVITLVYMVSSMKLSGSRILLRYGVSLFHLPAINGFPRLCVSITYISTARRHVRHAGGQAVDTMLVMVCSRRKSILQNKSSRELGRLWDGVSHPRVIPGGF